MPAELKSLAGQVLTDAQGRVLRIEMVQIGDSQGREIVGRLHGPSGEGGASYATDAQTFREVWIERTPPRTFEQQEAARKSLKV